MRLLRVTALTTALVLAAAIPSEAASQSVIKQDRSTTFTIADTASLAAQATLQQGHVTVADYRIFERTDPDASLLYIKGPTKHHRALFVFRQNVKVCVNLPLTGTRPTLAPISTKPC